MSKQKLTVHEMLAMGTEPLEAMSGAFRSAIAKLAANYQLDLVQMRMEQALASECDTQAHEVTGVSHGCEARSKEAYRRACEGYDE